MTAAKMAKTRPTPSSLMPLPSPPAGRRTRAPITPSGTRGSRDSCTPSRAACCSACCAWPPRHHVGAAANAADIPPAAAAALNARLGARTPVAQRLRRSCRRRTCSGAGASRSHRAAATSMSCCRASAMRRWKTPLFRVSQPGVCPPTVFPSHLANLVFHTCKNHGTGPRPPQRPLPRGAPGTSAGCLRRRWPAAIPRALALRPPRSRPPRPPREPHLTTPCLVTIHSSGWRLPVQD